MEFIKNLPSNPWAWIFLAICTMGGLVLAYRSTPNKKINYTKSTEILISNKKPILGKLSILYDDLQVDRLAVSKVTFWNGSFPTIERTHLIDNLPFCISVSNGKILDISIQGGSDTSNSIDFSVLDDSRSIVTFDYIDRNEGGILQIVHTGNNINISQKIKGGKIVSAKKGVKFYVNLFFLTIVFCSLWGVLMAFSDHYTRINIETKVFSISPELSTLFILSFIFYIIFLSLNIYKFFRPFIPKNCKESKKLSPFLLGLQDFFSDYFSI